MYVDLRVKGTAKGMNPTAFLLENNARGRLLGRHKQTVVAVLISCLEYLQYLFNKYYIHGGVLQYLFQ